MNTLEKFFAPLLTVSFFVLVGVACAKVIGVPAWAGAGLGGGFGAVINNFLSKYDRTSGDDDGVEP